MDPAPARSGGRLLESRCFSIHTAFFVPPFLRNESFQFGKDGDGVLDLTRNEKGE